ncbi:branched-chain amino acid aminotransferase [Metabacillus malikii]|uniref:Branched-chain amino acid aminotransferase n=1 Tax=Metabacillus malikii TaxID=1504265 RepID=A0ABT9ZDI5_9BACI|nr:branched-chain amino acid aminotransferase [Metabacillus malikii]MDQ0229999.1 hypothetical protein [Metabacillus malikii]
MSLKEFETYIKTTFNQQKSATVNIKLPLSQSEIDYIQKYEIIPIDNITIENSVQHRFMDAYIERGHKETEEEIGQETIEFLDKPLEFLIINIEEFIYIETIWFKNLGIDAISLELDDVFKTYDVMLGLKQPKKKEKQIKQYLNEQMSVSPTTFDLLFNQNEGIWEINLTLNDIYNFKSDFTIGEAYLFIYEFLFNLAVIIEEENN